MAEAASVTLEQKRMVAQTVEAAEHRGAVMAAFAASLGRSVRTIRRWGQQLRADVLGTKRPGPDAVAVPRSVRQGICAVLAAVGAAADEQLLRRLFSEATFSVIRGMKKRFRQVCAKRVRRGKSRLFWKGPGRAWAMDFTRPKAKVEGGQTHLLMIRDLASGCRLASVACKGEKSSTVIHTLELLFAAFGAPLVIKHDGGPGFIAQRTQTFLEEHDVFSVRSPAYTPEYNGSIERSLGWDKERIERVAELAGHGGYWTLEDIERARCQANATLFPRGLNGKTPSEAFDARAPITAKEREAFKRTVGKLTKAELEKHQDESGILTVRVGFETLERRAITRALVKHGYLTIRRGRISTPFPNLSRTGTREDDSVVSYRYDPYGAVTITRNSTTQSSDPLGNPWRYTGRFHDEESGLEYYRARYYSSVTGRFLQRDPLGYAVGANLYQYVHARPTTLIDPSGLNGEPPHPSTMSTRDLAEALRSALDELADDQGTLSELLRDLVDGYDYDIDELIDELLKYMSSSEDRIEDLKLELSRRGAGDVIETILAGDPIPPDLPDDDGLEPPPAAPPPGDDDSGGTQGAGDAPGTGAGPMSVWILCRNGERLLVLRWRGGAFEVDRTNEPWYEAWLRGGGPLPGR